MSFIDQVVWASAPYPCGLKGCSVCDYGKSQQEAKAHDPSSTCWCGPDVETVPSQTFEDRVVALAKVLIENDPDHANDFTGYSWKDAIEQATDIIAYANTEETCTCD